MRELTTATRTALLEHAARVKHELGRYVSFQTRFVSDDAPLSHRREALVADLLSTRRGPDGSVDVAEVWRGLKAPLLGQAPLPDGATVDLADDPHVIRIVAAMEVLTGLLPGLRDESLSADQVDRGRASALEVAEACRQLVRHLRAEAG